MTKKDKLEEKTKNEVTSAEKSVEEKQEKKASSKAKVEIIKDDKKDNKTDKKVEPAKKEEAKTNIATPKKQSFKKRHVPHGRAYIVCSYNNTVITITDLSGNVLGWASSGALGFKGPKKSTPFAATLVAQKVVEKTARFGLKEADVLIKGVGGGREASVRALGNAGWMIRSIKDMTPVPHNGCQPKKPRRV